MIQRFGFFGGSFDPIHNGHLNLAIELAEKHRLDGVFFCPTSQSPHKKDHPPIASKEARRAMVTAAISPLPSFTLLDLELQKTSYCYTIDTMRTLISLDQESKTKRNYFLLLGEDTLEKFHTWREVEELIKLAPPLVGTRLASANLKKGLTPIPTLDISSTKIRERLHKGQYCGHLLPAKVWDYIQQHKLYQNP